GPRNVVAEGGGAERGRQAVVGGPAALGKRRPTRRGRVRVGGRGISGGRGDQRQRGAGGGDDGDGGPLSSPGAGHSANVTHGCPPRCGLVRTLPAPPGGQTFRPKPRMVPLRTSGPF